HILEHSTLCGSDKYPLREPFVELVKGSLNTFLNAMTFPDKTMYPVASRNAKDFQNLMDVYLDAVFHPNLRKDPYILMQEGWHYELDDADQPLIYKGVVYNEMKGALSSPDDVLGQKAMEVLFPDTTYGYESGGDPDHIPELTFEAFTDFYQQYYHPSNAYFFLYGDMPLEETLTYISEKYLNEYHYREIDSEIATQSAPARRKKATFYYGVTEDEERQGKTLHAIDIVLPDTLSPAQMMAMEVWNYALLTIPGAPLRQEIISKGLATDVSGSIIDSLKQPVWHIEAIGSEREHQAALVQLFDAFMQKIAAQGFSSELLSAALNRLEFSLRENDFNGRPKGLFYNLRALNFWLYDRDPLQGLRYEEDIRELRDGITSGTFHTIIGDLICRNPHQAVITMAPQVGLQEEKEQAVREKLAAFKETLSPEKERRIIEQTATLKRRQ
ncbi:peptidase M16 inactive domain protein, partial [Anaerococcus hydrogenalis]